MTSAEVLAALFAYEATEEAPDFSGSVDAAGNEWPDDPADWFWGFGLDLHCPAR